MERGRSVLAQIIMEAMETAREVPVTKMEFAVQMTCSACETDVKLALRGVEGVFSTYVDVENDLVLVDTSLPSAHVQKLLEDTGKLVVFRGIGGTAGGDSIGGAHGAAVAIFRDGGVNGLARLVQTDAECCVVEGTVDGLHPGPYQLQVRQYGDLSKGCLSCGEVLSLAGEKPAAGDLGTVQVDNSGRAEFRLVSQKLQVWNLIGRSLALQSTETERNVCSIIARSAGLFQNTKRVCTCDGVTLWDEAKKPSFHAAL